MCGSIYIGVSLNVLSTSFHQHRLDIKLNKNLPKCKDLLVKITENDKNSNTFTFPVAFGYLSDFIIGMIFYFRFQNEAVGVSSLCNVTKYKPNRNRGRRKIVMFTFDMERFLAGIFKIQCHKIFSLKSKLTDC